MQLLDRGSLKALAPSQSDAEITGRKHGTYLWSQTIAEIAVVDQTESCRNVQPFQEVELVLYIKCRCTVVSRSRLRTVWSFQIVVTVFCTHIQRVGIRQIKHPFQLSHYTLLVTLQLTLPRFHQYGIPLSIKVAELLSLQQHIFVGSFRIIIVVGMLVPVNIH